jgi:cobalt-zinc-cadmium efflux system outer membrane protein
MLQPDPALGRQARPAARGRRAGADEARAAPALGWVELATRIKLTYAQHHVHLLSIRHAKESLDLMRRVADIARTRYASGLGGQQDALRAQTEIVAMETDLACWKAKAPRPAPASVRCWVARRTSSCARRKSCVPCRRSAKLELKVLEDRLRANNPQLAAEDARIVGAEKTANWLSSTAIPMSRSACRRPSVATGSANGN